MKKFITLFWRSQKKAARQNISESDYGQEMLVKLGREQFKRLVEKGLSIPIALL